MGSIPNFPPVPFETIPHQILTTYLADSFNYQLHFIVMHHEGSNETDLPWPTDSFNQLSTLQPMPGQLLS